MNLFNVIWNVPYFRVRFIKRIPEEEYAKVLLLIVCTKNINASRFIDETNEF